MNIVKIEKLWSKFQVKYELPNGFSFHIIRYFSQKSCVFAKICFVFLKTNDDRAISYKNVPVDITDQTRRLKFVRKCHLT